jgi:hypothetical protein
MVGRHSLVLVQIMCLVPGEPMCGAGQWEAYRATTT